MPWVSKQRLHELEAYETAMQFLLHADENTRQQYIKDFDELQRMAKESMNASGVKAQNKESL